MRPTSPAFVFALSALGVALVGLGCAGEPTARPPTDAPRTTPRLPDAPPPSPLPIASSATPSTGNGKDAADGGASPRADSATPSAAEQRADMKAANAFTASLYGRVRRTSGNVMISGASLRQALGIAYLGARGETSREMAAALGMPADLTRVVALAKAEATDWHEARGSAELFAANRLWADKAFAMKDSFTSAAAAAFGTSGVEPIDFTGAPEVARRAINAWVAEKTADKITDLLGEGAVDKRTRVVVTNATYFKARWAAPFAMGATRDEPFKATPARSANVPMMHATGSHRYAHVGAAKVLEMRYDSSKLAMLVVLPDEPAGLTKLEESLTVDTFETWTKALARSRVAITLPKFAFTWGLPLAAPLQALGIHAALSSKCDLGGIADAPGLQISQVVHRTWVAVDETGTEAAAATGLTMSVTSAAMGPIADFKADHPFLFFIYDEKAGRILFVGRVSEPKS